MDAEINARFELIEKRLDILETKKINHLEETDNKKGEQNFSGLAGGIRMLIENGFLNSPKNFKEIKEELKREGYHYSDAGIISTLTETFIKSKKILTRIKEDKFWKYVIRK
jgi:hypothetical protein